MPVLCLPLPGRVLSQLLGTVLAQELVALVTVLALVILDKRLAGELGLGAEPVGWL